LPERTTFGSFSNGGIVKKIKHIRATSFLKQSGLCYYCEQPMWISAPAAFLQQHRLKISRVRWLQATAEHLVAKRDGGIDFDDNVVAACLFCNTTRHKHRPNSAPPPDVYRRHVRKRLAKGKWHGIRLSCVQ
jgi:heme oxygenase